MDWPQFRFGSNRGASSPEGLPVKLYLQWSREFATPSPAFPGEVRLRYDATYEPVVMGDTLFVPSMVTDSVTALDTANGKVRWRFFTGGPVRFWDHLSRAFSCLASPLQRPIVAPVGEVGEAQACR